MTSTHRMYINNERIKKGDLASGIANKQILLDSRINAAVLETARVGLIKYGSGIERCDVVGITNIADEHLGEFGIETRSDISNVKGLLVELAEDVVVLYADISEVVKLRDRSNAKQVILFSQKGTCEHVVNHISTGNTAIKVENKKDKKFIFLYSNYQRHPLLDITEIPISFNGAAAFNLENSMCAAEIAFGLGHSLEVIAEGIKTFKNTFEHNPWRMNEILGFPCRVIVDFCHNYHGLNAVIPVLKTLVAKRRIMIFSIPGNRRQIDYRLAIEMATNYCDELHLYTNENLRKTKSISEILETFRICSKQVNNLKILVSYHSTDDSAIEAALTNVSEGDLLFAASSDCENLYQKIKFHSHLQDF